MQQPAAEICSLQSTQLSDATHMPWTSDQELIKIQPDTDNGPMKEPVAAVATACYQEAAADPAPTAGTSGSGNCGPAAAAASGGSILASPKLERMDSGSRNSPRASDDAAMDEARRLHRLLNTPPTRSCRLALSSDLTASLCLPALSMGSQKKLAVGPAASPKASSPKPPCDASAAPVASGRGLGGTVKEEEPKECRMAPPPQISASASQGLPPGYAPLPEPLLLLAPPAPPSADKDADDATMLSLLVDRALVQQLLGSARHPSMPRPGTGPGSGTKRVPCFISKLSSPGAAEPPPPDVADVHEVGNESPALCHTFIKLCTL